MELSVRENIAERLRAAREQAGLTQGQVAKLLGMNRPTISEIEAGRRKISAEELKSFSKIYCVSISWLINAEPEIASPALELAARELAKLKPEDLTLVLNLLNTLRRDTTESI